MTALVDNTLITCPYCWSTVELDVDCTAGDQTYYEDCQICCGCIEISIHIDENGNLLFAEARRENE